MICNRCKVNKDEKEFVPNNHRCERCRKYLAEYYEQHQGACIERAQKSIKKKGRAAINAEKRERYRRLPASPILCALRRRAKQLGIAFNLTTDDIVIPETCPILGIKLEVGNGHSMRNSPSIDRIDPTKGYVRGNIQFISHKANTMKSDATLEELRMLVRFMESLAN
jgi:hypothetical protein